MKVVKINTKTSEHPIMVNDCHIGSGYLQGASGSLPDVDIDYASDRRQDVKAYTERRYNHVDDKGNTTCYRVLSAGTMTTLKAKAVIKDVARTMRIPVNTVNYVTGMISDDGADWTELFRMAKTNQKLAAFIEKYPTLFENIRSLMMAPRASSVHASALLITPDEKDGRPMECFDFIPIKKSGDMLVSENTGTELDELGLLKNDCLATKELSKFYERCTLINEGYGTDLNFDKLMLMTPDDPGVFEMLSQGFTCDVFQFSSKGITNMMKEMRPDCIEDLVAMNALYRPATLATGMADEFINRKHGLCPIVYPWGTEEILKDTYACLCYQESLSQIAIKVGKFSTSHAIQLVKYISKKKKDKIAKSKEEFIKGATSQGCPIKDATDLWNLFEAAGSYLFNKSHATAYALTAYWGAYLKYHYPTAFYTVALKWAEEKKELPAIMAEMEMFSDAKLVQPDVNRSGLDFTPDFETNEIVWSLTKIKQCTVKSMSWIIEEREKNGAFSSFPNFIDRIFKYKLKKYEYFDDPDNEDEETKCPINARHVLNLIFAGAFDKVENIEYPQDRWQLVKYFASIFGTKLSQRDFPDDLVDKHYFWSQQQQIISGLGSINYRRIFDASLTKPTVKGKCTYRTLEEILDEKMQNRKVVVCCTIASVEERQYNSTQTNQKETMCKLILQQGSTISECIAWAEAYGNLKDKLQHSKGKIAIFTATVRYSEFHQKNELQFTHSSVIELV